MFMRKTVICHSRLEDPKKECSRYYNIQTKYYIYIYSCFCVPLRDVFCGCKACYVMFAHASGIASGTAASALDWFIG